MLGWGGVPVLWMGDELGLPSDPDWAAEPGHEADNRWAHRPRMDPARQAERARRGHEHGRGVRRPAPPRSRCARALPLLHASTQSEVLDPSDPGVLAVLRSHPEGELLELFNVTETWRPFPAHRLAERGLPPATGRADRRPRSRPGPTATSGSRPTRRCG